VCSSDLIIKRLKGQQFLIIPGIIIIASLLGAALGLAEEFIPFAMILIPLLIRLGYDGITAMLTVYCSLMIGFSTSWMNPYTIMIAQSIAGVPILSGAALRIAMYIIFEAALFLYIIKRIKKYKEHPEAAITYETDTKYFRNADGGNYFDAMEGKEFTKGHAVVLIAFVLGFVWIFWGIFTHGWYLPQMSAQLMAIAIVCGGLGAAFKLNGMRINDIASAFKQGLSDLVPVVMILALAKGVTLLLGGVDNSIPSVLNTILYHAGEAVGSVPQIFAAWGMYLFQALFNFLVNSGPAMAAITMPIMAPLSDIVGVSRQVACLAYQMGDGFTNMINPTSAVLMAFLGIAKIDFVTWLKFQWKMQTVILAGASIVMIIAVVTGY
jgi:uncharacterized ion transporter superfamily protein YfcC